MGTRKKKKKLEAEIEKFHESAVAGSSQTALLPMPSHIASSLCNTESVHQKLLQNI